MVTEVKRSQIEDAVCSSRAALAVEEDPQERVIGTLLIQAEAGGRGEGVLDNENNGRVRWQPSLIERVS